MNNFRRGGAVALLGMMTAAAVAAPAQANGYGPYEVGDGVTLDPMLDARLRYEHVDQNNALSDADSVTLRMRPGVQLAFDGGLSFLVEGEATIAIAEDFNSTTNGKGGFSVVADPENIELNRAQVHFKKGGSAVTLGRQRIVLDDSRWVGNVGWRQNEQTFDAIRVQTDVLGPVKLDGTWSISQRSIFGVDSGPRQAFDGNFYFGSAGVDIGPVNVKAFTYLLDFDESEPRAAAFLDTKTFGFLAEGKVPLGQDFSVAFKGSYAMQKDWRDNSALGNDYSVDYVAAELGASYKGFTLAGGYEQLGAETNTTGTFSLMTPMATLHKFNGWADAFLVTPAQGIRDYYVKAVAAFPKVKAVKGLKFMVFYHKFDSDIGGFDYGDEIDADISFKAGPINVGLRYAHFDRDSNTPAGFNFPDTDKFWLNLGYGF